MKLPLLITLLATSTILFVGCASNERIQIDGIPEWIAGGGKLSSEPEPFKPDPAILPYEDDSGPVEVTFITDKKYRYPTPPEKKKEKVSTHDPLERGRDYRIKRLFR